MIRTIATGLMAAAISTTSLAADLPQVEWVGDLPIMPQLSVESGLGFAFDSPEGRIVTIYLSGDSDQAELAAYYGQALEPLGWQARGGLAWSRDGEALAFQPVTAGGSPLWKITIRPQ